MDDFLLFVISLGVTAVGLVGSWGAYRRRGAASGMRGAAWSLVPMGAYLTGTTKFLADLALSPSKWAGVLVVGLAVVLYMVSGVMLRRGAGQGGADGGEGKAGGRGKAQESPKAAKGPARRPAKGAVEQGKPDASGLGDDLGDIQEILKRRGIG